MKSRRNLTRFTYENSAFLGWRLCITRSGTTFTRYFPDKKYGGVRQSLAAAEACLAELRPLLDGSRKIKGKLTATTQKKAEKLLSSV